MFKSVRSRKSLTGQAEIQMTPLIDMGPRAGSSESLPRESIRIAVRADGQIVLDGQEVGLFSVRPHLERGLRNQPGLAAVIVADRIVPVERIVQVMDEIRAAGVADIALATEKRE